MAWTAGQIADAQVQLTHHCAEGLLQNHSSHSAAARAYPAAPRAPLRTEFAPATSSVFPLRPINLSRSFHGLAPNLAAGRQTNRLEIPVPLARAQSLARLLTAPVPRVLRPGVIATQIPAPPTVPTHSLRSTRDCVELIFAADTSANPGAR